MIMIIWCALIMSIVVDMHKAPCTSSSIKQYSGSHANSTINYGEEDSRYGKLQYQTMIPSSTRAMHYSHVDNGYCWWGNVNNDILFWRGGAMSIMDQGHVNKWILLVVMSIMDTVGGGHVNNGGSCQ